MRLARRQRVLGPQQKQRLTHRLAEERHSAGEHLVEDDAERVHVTERADLLEEAGGLLRRHVGRRTHDGAGTRLIDVLVELLGQAEVGHLGHTVGRQQHVDRLQVAMNDALAVGRRDGLGQRLKHLRRPTRRLRRPGHLAGQTAALDELQREERQVLDLADLVDLHDVRMLQTGQQLRPRSGSAQVVLVGQRRIADHLQGDDAPQLEMPRR